MASHVPPAPGIFNSPEWRRVLADAFGYAIEEVPLAGGGTLPLAKIDDPVGRRLVGLPFSDYLTLGGGAAALADALQRIGRDWPDYAVSLRIAGDDWGCGEAAACYHRVAIGDEAEMTARMSPAFRRGLNKATREGLSVRIGTSVEDIERFHRLYCLHRQKKFGLLSQSRRFFAEIHAAFLAVGQGWVLEARNDDGVLAAALVLRHGDGLYYKLGASVMERNQLAKRPNNILFARLLSFAKDAGSSYIDLGMSWTHEGDAELRRFKEGIGGVAHPVTVVRQYPDGYDIGRAERVREMLRDVTRFCVEELTTTDQLDRAGERFFRYFT